jgi:hypothetical protein
MLSIRDRAQQIKDTVSLEALVTKDLGKPVQQGNTWAKWPCPMHRESDPSFTVHKDTNSFFCYGACGVGGDAIRYVQWRMSYTFVQAVEHLENELNISAEIARPKKPVKREKVNKATWQDVLRYHGNREPGLAYFGQRGIQTDTFDDHWLGARIDWNWTWKDSKGKRYQQHCHRYTIPSYLPLPNNPFVRGIIMRRDDAMCVEYLEENPGVRDMVIEDQINRGVSEDRAQARLLDLLFGPKYWKTPGHQGLIYNVGQLIEWRDDKWVSVPLEYVLIQESQMDTLVTVQEGYPAVQTKIGSGFGKKDLYDTENAAALRKAFKEVRNVFIVQDADEAGENYALNMFSALGRGTVVQVPTGFKDSNDVYTKGNFNKWMSESGIPRMERST